MLDLVGLRTASQQFVAYYRVHRTGLPSATVFREFRDEHLVETRLPGDSRQFPDQVVRAIAGLTETKRFSCRFKPARHIE